MTDLEKWKAHFKEFNIEFTETKRGPTVEGLTEDKWDNRITLETDSGCGYSGFVFAAYFSHDGKFLEFGVWE